MGGGMPFPLFRFLRYSCFNNCYAYRIKWNRFWTVGDCDYSILGSEWFGMFVPNEINFANTFPLSPDLWGFLVEKLPPFSCQEYSSSLTNFCGNGSSNIGIKIHKKFRKNLCSLLPPRARAMTYMYTCWSSKN